MESEINTPPTLNSISKTDISNFYTLFSNIKESKKLLNLYRNFINGYLETLNGYYKQLTEINWRFLDKDSLKSSITKSPILKLGKIIKNILETRINNLFSLISDTTFFISFDNSLNNLSKIVQDSSIIINKKIFENEEPITNSLYEKYEDIESIIIDNYIYNKYNKHLDIINNESLENSVQQAQFLEKTILDLDEKNKIQMFEILKEMESKTINVYSEMKHTVENIIKTLQIQGAEYLKKLEEGINLIHNMPLETVNNNEKNKEETQIELNKFIDLDMFKYKIKILESPIIKIDDKNNKKLKERKTKTKADNQKNKNDNEIKTEEILYNNELTLTDEDIYNIVSTIYSYDLKMINKSEYELDKEKQKLEVSNLSEKLLSYNVEDNINETITEEEVNKLYDLLLNNKTNLMKFFIILNNYRVTRRCNMTERVYKIIGKIFNISLDNLLKEKNKQLEGLIIILSQTFYMMENEKKIYLLEIIKDHDLFKKGEFWKNHLENIINEEINKIEEDEKDGRVVFSKEVKEKKIKQLITAKIIPFSNNMLEFGASKEVILNIINPIMDKYNLDENSRVMSLSLLEQIQ